MQSFRFRILVLGSRRNQLFNSEKFGSNYSYISLDSQFPQGLSHISAMKETEGRKTPNKSRNFFKKEQKPVSSTLKE